MGSKNDLVEWAVNGTRDASYSVAKIQNGWEIGEPPVARRWNAREYERDVLINHVKGLAESTLTACPTLTPAEICSELNVDQWVSPTDDVSQLDTSLAIRDSCCGWSFTNDNFQLLVLDDAGDIYPMPYVGVYTSSLALGSAIAFDYPATPDVVYALCSDMTYVYVVWGVTGGNFKVSKFAANSLLEIWTTDTGIAITYSVSNEDIRIIVSSSDTVTALLPGVVFGMTCRQVGVFNKTTGAGSYGKGSYVTSYGDGFAQQNAKIVSDGTHVFWLQYQSGTGNRTYYLISAALADPTTSSYASAEVITVSDSTPESRPKGLLCVGESVFMATAAGYLSMYSTTDDEVKAIYQVSLDQGPLLADAQDVVLGFDRLNIWMTLIITDAGHSGRLTEIVAKIPCGAITYRMAVAGYDGIKPASVAITRNITAETTYTSGKLVFDMQDIWLINRTGFMHRIGNPGAR